MSRNENEYTIYIRSTRESIPVTKKEFDAYYHDIDLFRRKQQKHGKCVCPRCKQLICDMDCYTCPFYRAGDARSLDYCDATEDGSEESWVNQIQNEDPLVEEIIAEAFEARELYNRLAELMPEALEIGRLRLSGMPDTAIAKDIGITNTTFRSRLAKAKSILIKEFPDFF